jgi:hypothetical protein
MAILYGHFEPITLEAYDVDQFTVKGEELLFRFRRDAKHIIGFELDAGSIKNLMFIKEYIPAVK